MLLGKFKIVGHSMQPLLNPGQEIIVSKIPYFFGKPKKGDLVAFKEENRIIIKRIQKTHDRRFFVLGDNKKDSKEFGWVDSRRILGKVIYILGS
jgi:signal peptidase I